MSWSLLFSILRSPGRPKMASCDHTRALAKHLTEGMIVSGQLCVKVALPSGFATCLKLTCGANRMRRFIPAHVLMTRPAGKLTAAVDHAYSMAEYARVWAERASSIVDAPRTEVCQQPEAGEKKSCCCCVVVVSFSKAASCQTTPFVRLCRASTCLAIWIMLVCCFKVSLTRHVAPNYCWEAWSCSNT